MTNTELLAKIKAEIERLIKLHDSLASNAESEMIANLEIGAAQALDDILPFLSALESENPMNLEGLEEELDNWRHEHFQGKRDGHFSGEYLERTSQLDLAHHFAQWGRGQMMQEAAEGTYAVTTVGHFAFFPDKPIKDLCFGDKVRIIICKKEEKCKKEV